MSLAGKARWALRHPAFAARPVRSVLRLAVWRTRTACGIGATVPVAGGALRFRCPPEWRGNAKLTYVWGDTYEPEIAGLPRWVRPGDLVADVGAHYGSYTLPLARLVGPAGRVLALEPARHAHAVLTHNVALNRLGQVTPLRAAAGDRAGRAVLHDHPDHSRAQLASGGSDGPAGSEGVEVVALDRVLPPGRRLSLLKVDAEGSEGACLRGAARTLERDTPVVLFEYAPATAAAAGTSPDAAWQHLADLGYRLHRITAEGLVPHPDPRRHPYATNLVALHPAPRFARDGDPAPRGAGAAGPDTPRA